MLGDLGFAGIDLLFQVLLDFLRHGKPPGVKGDANGVSNKRSSLSNPHLRRIQNASTVTIKPGRCDHHIQTSGKGNGIMGICEHRISVGVGRIQLVTH